MRVVARDGPADDIRLTATLITSSTSRTCARPSSLLESCLRHLDVDERAQRWPVRRGVEGARSQHTARLELVEPGLGGPAGHTESPGELAHADPRIVEHDSEEPSVGVVKVRR